jgi:yeast amino acid transporter
MVVPADSPLLLNATKAKTSAAASPFVVAIQAAGIKTLPSIINACILIFTLSAANSDQYIASRTLYGLAMDGHAPAIFRRCNKLGVPYVALLFTGAFMALAYMTLSAGGSQTFSYFVSTVTIFVSRDHTSLTDSSQLLTVKLFLFLLQGGLTWCGISLSHIRFIHGLRAQGIDRNTLPYKAPLGVYGSYIALIFTFIVVLTKGFDSLTTPFNYKSFITNYIGLPVVLILYLAHKFYYKSKFIAAKDMDLFTGAREFNEADLLAVKEDEQRAADIKAAPFHKKIWMKMQDW